MTPSVLAALCWKLSEQSSLLRLSFLLCGERTCGGCQAIDRKAETELAVYASVRVQGLALLQLFGGRIAAQRSHPVPAAMP